MPTITQLEYIVAVDRLRHFGKAAKACHVSQPSLSMQLQKAEDELGVQIFDRHKKPITATDEGKPIIDQARQILREHERLLDISKNKSSALSGDFHLVVIPTLAPYIIPLFIEKFSSSFPLIRLKIDEMKTEDIIESLRSDTLDAGLLATPLREKNIAEFPVFYEPYYLYGPSNHELMKKRSIKEESLDQSEIWLLRDGHCLRNQVINFCSLRVENRGVYPNVSFEGGTLETLRHLIRKNKRGYTLMPHLFIDGLTAAEVAASVRPFVTPIPTREVSLVMRRGHWKLKMVEALREVIRKVVPKELLESSEKQIVLDI